MRLALPAILMLASLAACDSPGGGGGGTIVVDCSLTPEAPVCRRDTVGGDTTSTNDVTDSATDTGPSPVDTLDFETTVPDTVSSDTSQPDTLQPPECAGTARRCGGEGVEQCVSGMWVEVEACLGETTCQDGACVSLAQCSGNQTRCDGTDLERCSGGQWVFQQTCASGCSNGVCQSAQGTDTCMDVFSCVVDSGCFDTTPASASCTAPCLDAGSTLGRQEMTAVLNCYGTCNYDNACIVDQCSGVRAACFFDASGSGTCEDIDTCLGGCDTDACVDACYEASTTAAQALYLEVSQCVGVYCDSSDSTCINEVLTTGPCADEYNACFP